MTTKIESRRGIGAFRLDGSGKASVGVETWRFDGNGSYLSIDRADFLAAVETECGVRIVPANAIVIERAELPRVTVRADGSVSAKAFTWSKSADPDDLREIAACYLAAAEYLDAHPPVSDEDVETLARLLRPTNGPPAWAMARRLLATGRVSVTR